MACSRKSQLNDHLGVKVRQAPVEADPLSTMADANTECPCEVQDAVDILPIPIPITMCPWEERKTAHAIELERPPGRGVQECHA